MTNENVVIDAEYSEVESTEVDIVQSLTVLPENITALDFFINDNGEAEIILNRVIEHFSSLVFDMNTAKGRAECRSQTALIRKIKARMEELGKAEADKLKLLPKKVDNTRKSLKDGFDKLAETVRAPLTAYEAEEERKKAEEAEKKAAEERAKQEETERKEAELREREAELARKEQAILEEQAQKEREEKMKADALEEAQRLAELEILKAKNAEADALKAKEQAEKEKAEALAKAEQEKQAEIARIQAENAAKEQARIAEQKRLEAEEEKRKADQEHIKAVNRAVIASIEEELGFDAETAKRIAAAIYNKKIANVTINY